MERRMGRRVISYFLEWSGGADDFGVRLGTRCGVEGFGAGDGDGGEEGLEEPAGGRFSGKGEASEPSSKEPMPRTPSEETSKASRLQGHVDFWYSSMTRFPNSWKPLKLRGKT